MLGEPAHVAHLRPLIQSALDRGGNLRTIEDLYASVLTGAMQLWVADDASAVLFTELAVLPRAKIVRTLIAAGELKGVLSLQSRVAKWALGLGFTRTEITGSPAWMRLLRRRFDFVETVGYADTEEFLNEQGRRREHGHTDEE